MVQFELFMDARPPPTTPIADGVRARLDAILASLQAANNMQWTAPDARYWSIVVPQMANWLPPDERDAVHAAFTAEITRLQDAKAA